jgi:hypothetical protein
MDKKFTKSRFGCRECKIRRVKCDEARPACRRCSKSGRQCSYLTEIPNLPVSPTSTGTSSSTTSTQKTGPLESSSTSVSISASLSATDAEPLPTALSRSLSTDRANPSCAATLDEHYGLLHLNLLYYFEHEMASSMGDVHPGLDAIIPLLVVEALKTPYLMDEMLALAAAHKSAQASRSQLLLYSTEATRLQTRALETFNGLKPQVSAENCIPMLIFSSFVGQHALFDMSNTVSDDLGTMLEGLIRCIGLHRGIGIISEAAWPLMQARLGGEVTQACTGAGSSEGIEGLSHSGEVDALLRRLNDDGLSGPKAVANHEAARILKRIFTSLSPSSPVSHWMAAMQEWLISVSSDYVEYLRQRRQETLVVLAHYAVVLHYSSRYWFIGDLGARLVHLISVHLGPFWEDWLAWPNQMIREKHGGTG